MQKSKSLHGAINCTANFYPETNYIAFLYSKNNCIKTISFIYNMGLSGFINSSVFTKLNHGDYIGAANAFDE